MLSNHGNSLLTRFEQVGDMDDLNKSVSMIEDAVQLSPDGHPGKPSILNNLGNSLLARFGRLGNLDDLNKSMLMGEDAVYLTPDGHPDKPLRLNNLGNSLCRRFQQLGNLDDFTKSMSVTEDAVRLTSDGHPDKPSRLNNLGTSLSRHFERLGDLDDLNRAVSMREDAVHLTPDGHPNKPSILNNLGNSLLTRFERLGELDDLNKSVLMTEDAVCLTPDGHPDKPLRLNNLGNSLLTHFEQLGDLDNLNKAVSMGEDAVHLTPDGHPDKPSRLNNLGNSLCRRFQQLGNLDDFNKSMSVTEDAVRLTPYDHPDKPLMLNNLGYPLFCRFERLGDLDDLNKSIIMREDAVNLTPEGHPAKPGILANLENSLFLRFERLGDHTDLKRAISLCDLASRSTTGPAHIRFQAASKWAQLARIKDDSSLLEAYNVALDLLPELAWLGLSISDRHHHLLRTGKLVRDAAAFATASDQVEKAVEWLEQGHSVIWGQLLNLRSPVDDLKHNYPKLAHSLVSLSTALQGSGTQTSGELIQSATQLSPQSVADRAHHNAQERKKLLKEIRQLVGFQRFLLPKTISELSPAAQEGPVVILNITDDPWDALVLMAGLNDEVMHIPLNDFKPNHAGSMAQSLGHLVWRSERLVIRCEGQIDPEDEFANNLSQLWKEVIKPVLNALAMTTSTKVNLPRLYRMDDAFGSKLSDFVISFYTPSLTALVEGFRSPSKEQRVLQLLAVVQPYADGQTPIPETRKKIDCIQQLALGRQLPVLRLDGQTATVERVQRGMRDSNWVHFACHGVQNVSQPTQSALLLAGREKLTLSNIIQLALPHADLAFLSACQTATGDKSLEEEAVQLAAGMQLAGYRGVIATMWAIMDNEAPQVASDVYEHLLNVTPPDPARAAEALHLAIRKLREESGGYKSFSHSVPFIHIGV
ncbi:CHAT domain-containing protein [Mycena capillaripes]|nr:CHAT domain-containing protein [Mycena capillaripes]